MLGKKLEPILLELEMCILEHDAFNQKAPNYSNESFRAITKIFMSALMDKLWTLQENESIDMNDRMKMATAAGTELRKLIKTFTGIDTIKLYKDETP